MDGRPPCRGRAASLGAPGASNPTSRTITSGRTSRAARALSSRLPTDDTANPSSASKPARASRTRVLLSTTSTRPRVACVSVALVICSPPYQAKARLPIHNGSTTCSRPPVPPSVSPRAPRLHLRVPGVYGPCPRGTPPLPHGMQDDELMNVATATDRTQLERVIPTHPWPFTRFRRLATCVPRVPTRRHSLRLRRGYW